MKRTLVFFVLTSAFCAVFLTSAGPAKAWNSYIHQRLAWFVEPEFARTPLSGYCNAMIFGADEPDRYKSGGHYSPYQRSIKAFNASIGAFRRGCFQESLRRLGHAFHYLEDLGCCRKAFGGGIKSMVEERAFKLMKNTVNSHQEETEVRRQTRDIHSAHFSNLWRVEAVLDKLATSRQGSETMIRNLERQHLNSSAKKIAYTTIVGANLVTTLAAMIQMTRIYKRATGQIWSTKQYSPQCHCPNNHRMNQARNDCFFGNHSQTITLPRW